MGKVTLSDILSKKPAILYTSHLPISTDKNDIRIGYELLCNHTEKRINQTERILVVIRNKKIHCIFDGEVLFSSMNGFGLIKKHYERTTSIEVAIPNIISDYLRINREKLL